MKKCKCKSNCFIILGNVNCKINKNGKRYSELNIYVIGSSQIQCDYIKIITKKIYYIKLIHKGA